MIQGDEVVRVGFLGSLDEGQRDILRGKGGKGGREGRGEREEATNWGTVEDLSSVAKLELVMICWPK